MTGTPLPPIAYMDRTRAWYLALGYDNPYQWAHHDDAPFTPLRRPLAQSTVALVTTAAPYRPDLPGQGPGDAYNGEAKFFSVWSKPVSPAPDVRISHIAYDRKHTSAKDPNTWNVPHYIAEGLQWLEAALGVVVEADEQQEGDAG